jgi:hypothetical protein
MVMEINPSLPDDFKYLAYQVRGISSHDSCIMVPPPGTPGVDFIPLAMFPDQATAYDAANQIYILGSANFPSPYFSILVPYGKGQVIVVGNSGMIGDYGSPNPAPGIVNLENNLMFFLNCVSYLGGLRCTKLPDPGYGPKC